jgi:hypothetical protein
VNPERLVVYGSSCTWWGYPEEAARHWRSDLPVCPHCARPLFQTSEAEWLRGVEAFRPEPGSMFDGIDYPVFVQWLRRRRCAPATDEGMAVLVELFRHGIGGTSEQPREVRKLRPIPAADRIARIDQRAPRRRGEQHDANRRRRQAQKRSRRKNR